MNTIKYSPISLVLLATLLLLVATVFASQQAPAVEARVQEADVVAAESAQQFIQATAEPTAEAAPKWCSGVTIRYFVGGDPGDAFASIVHKGALAAEADLGPTVEYVFSGWDPQKMLDQLRDAIAAKPDGIAMMGHAGDDAIMPLAEEASKAGILMMYQNVDVPLVRAKFGGGYVGANLEPQGRALAQEAIRQFGLKAGDHALVFGPWGQPGRYIREEGVAKAFEEAGLVVERLDAVQGSASDPNLLTPSISAAVLSDPEVKLITYAGGQVLGASETYMQAIGKKPGEILNIGFDTSPAVIDGFKKGYIQLTSDQQPFQQGYLPILSLCGSKIYGFAPLVVDTGAGFVDATNYEAVAEWANKGYR
ncbi:MAG: substrate-binding domain-containing protein [Anaerolineae bacterium]|nr:substrate-binding domain-containing protein [Anaerolineales bacterium]MCQ3976953.1 sugar ABC transporter substrate-binding protein [Anaerolineae bacterium]